MASSILHSTGAYRDRFALGLESLLGGAHEVPPMGAFVLVCANAYFDPALCLALRPALERTFHQFCADGNFTFRATAGASDDDIVVFMRICGEGLDELPVTEFKDLGPWRVQFNRIRAFRPRERKGGN